MDSPRDDARFQLVFSGECLAGHDGQAVRGALAGALKLNEKRAARLFSGHPVVVRKDVDAAAAFRYVAMFASMGAVLHAEPSAPRPPRPIQASAKDDGGSARLVSTVDRPPRRWADSDMLYIAVGAVFGLLLVFGLRMGAPWFAPSPSATDAEQGAASAEARLPLASPSLPPAAPLRDSPSPTPAAANETFPQDMTAEAMSEYKQVYRSAPNHKAFAISSDGAYGWDAGAAGENEARGRALAACMRGPRPVTHGCRVVEADGDWQE